MLGYVLAGLLLVLTVVAHSSAERSRRGTYQYPEELRHYAKTHPGTRLIHGSVGRYAPHEWPAWYMRNMYKWNGHTRLGPYHPNDVRYLGYQRNKIFRGV